MVELMGRHIIPLTNEHLLAANPILAAAREYFSGYGVEYWHRAITVSFRDSFRRLCIWTYMIPKDIFQAKPTEPGTLDFWLAEKLPE